MASLKEVKRRIVSVEGTQKITVARQMISSALLHRTQDMLVKTQAYKQAIDELYAKSGVADDVPKHHSPGSAQGKTGIILISSNSGMCGPFNMNILKEATHLEERYPGKELICYPIGKKIREALLHNGQKIGFEGDSNWDHLIEKPGFEKSAEAARYFSGLYASGELEQLVVVYTHFHTIASQEIIHLSLLPYKPDVEIQKRSFIIEPSPEVVRKELQERSIRAAFHTIIIDSLTSEYAARTIAMQLASENANELLSELQILYNKVRQQNITSELLDIVGNSFA